MPIFIWVSEVVFAIFWLYSAYAVINPKGVADMTIGKYEKAMDFYAFKATIKPTKRSESIIRLGHLGVLLLLTIYMTAVYLYGEKFLLTLFNY